MSFDSTFLVRLDLAALGIRLIINSSLSLLKKGYYRKHQVVNAILEDRQVLVA